MKLEINEIDGGGYEYKIKTNYTEYSVNVGVNSRDAQGLPNEYAVFTDDDDSDLVLYPCPFSVYEEGDILNTPAGALKCARQTAKSMLSQLILTDILHLQEALSQTF